MGGAVSIRAGQIWRAPAPRVKGGYRYVRIEQVRGTEEAGRYALLREVTPAGRRKGALTGRTPSTGERFDLPPISTVVRHDVLESPYEFVREREGD